MMMYGGHSFELLRNNNWEIMEEFAKMMGGHSDIWYATLLKLSITTKSLTVCSLPQTTALYTIRLLLLHGCTSTTRKS